MGRWSRRSEKTPEPPAVRWLSGSESPFDVPVLDCRPSTQNRVAGTSSQEIADRFVQQRSWLGEELGSRQFTTEVPVSGRLRYPLKGGAEPDGPVFKASSMEEKWDLYLRAGRLYFVRSWTGDACYAAEVSWRSEEWSITRAWQADTVHDDVQLSLRVMDYLIKSHLFGLAAPHPLRVAVRGDDEKLGLASFADFGRRALYGTFDDLIGNAAVANALWRGEE